MAATARRNGDLSDARIDEGLARFRRASDAPVRTVAPDNDDAATSHHELEADHQVLRARPRHVSRADRGPLSDDPRLEAEREKLLRDWGLVKAARFYAARRLRNKHEAAQLTFALSGIYGFVVPLFTLQFAGELGDLNARLISFVAACAGALSFIIAMHYQWQSFPERAKALHDCALGINDLRKRLKIESFLSTDVLADYLSRYNDLLQQCENHADIDFQIARADRASGGIGLGLQWRKARTTYGLCWIIWAAPVSIGAALWVAFA